MRWAVIGTLALLAACDTRPKHAEWQNVCVREEMEMMMMPVFMPDGRGGGTTTLQPQWYPVCVETEVRCVAGRDGSTTCR